jgi:hypothetical protein
MMELVIFIIGLFVVAAVVGVIAFRLIGQPLGKDKDTASSGDGRDVNAGFGGGDAGRLGGQGSH